MTAQDIIKEAQESASEWLEMTDDPSMFIAEMLANKIIKMNGYIEYLERRVEHVTR